MVRIKNLNNCVKEAHKQHNELVTKISEREKAKEEYFKKNFDFEYIPHFTTEDLNKVKDAQDLIRHHIGIRDIYLVDNGRSAFNIPERRKKH